MRPVYVREAVILPGLCPWTPQREANVPGETLARLLGSYFSEIPPQPGKQPIFRSCNRRLTKRTVLLVAVNRAIC